MGRNSGIYNSDKQVKTIQREPAGPSVWMWNEEEAEEEFISTSEALTAAWNLHVSRHRIEVEK